MAKKKSRKKAAARGTSAKTAGRNKPARKTAAKGKCKKTTKKAAYSTARKSATKNAPKTGRFTSKGRRIVEMRTWRRIGRLASDAIAALEAGNVKDAKRLIQSIEAVATCADEA